MDTTSNPDHEPNDAGRELSLDGRFHFRAIRPYTYKVTPQLALQLHVHFPHDWRRSDRRPAIIFFFGGGLQGGTVEQFTRQAVYLVGCGMVVVRADYRLIPKHGVTAADCVADAKSAVRWIRTHADMLGVDPARIAAAGGSSGGFLAAATGVLPGFDEPAEDAAIISRPDLLVLYNPAFELHSHTVASGAAYSEDLKGIGTGCFAPSEDLAQSLHIASHLTAGAPPMWVWYGAEDKFYRLGQAVLTRARDLGCSMVVHVTDGADHGAFNDALSVYRETLESMAAFLRAYDYLE